MKTILAHCVSILGLSLALTFAQDFFYLVLIYLVSFGMSYKLISVCMRKWSWKVNRVTFAKRT